MGLNGSTIEGKIAQYFIYGAKWLCGIISRLSSCLFFKSGGLLAKARRAVTIYEYISIYNIFTSGKINITLGMKYHLDIAFL